MNALLLVSIGACAKQPAVPEERYVELSPQSVQAVEALRAHEEALVRGIPEAELAVVEARRREDLAADRLALLEEALKAEDDVKRVAVESGDAAAAAASDQRRAEHEAAIADAQVSVREMGRQRELAEAELELLRADVDLVHAEMELERAQGVDPSGDEIRIGRFERAVDKATARRSEAADRVDRARNTAPAT